MQEEVFTMQALRIETTLTEDRTLVLKDLPFHAGDSVEVIIKERPMPPKEPGRYPLRGTVLKYDDPTEPVALEDWEALR
jgi:hypothetical protein